MVFWMPVWSCMQWWRALITIRLCEWMKAVLVWMVVATNQQILWWFHNIFYSNVKINPFANVRKLLMSLPSQNMIHIHASVSGELIRTWLVSMKCFCKHVQKNYCIYMQIPSLSTTNSYICFKLGCLHYNQNSHWSLMYLQLCPHVTYLQEMWIECTFCKTTLRGSSNAPQASQKCFTLWAQSNRQCFDHWFHHVVC